MTGPDIGALLRGQAPAPSDEHQLLTIGEFGRRARLSARALRLYDRMGVLVPDQVDPFSGYRRYRVGQLATARLIAMLRRLDMPLSDVAQLMAAPADERAALVETYWQDVETRVAFQRELARHVGARLSGRPFEPAALAAVARRHVPEQLVLTERRHVRAPELATWLEMAFARLVAAADRHGGVAGHPFAVYLGEVNVDSDGPVEVCVPVRDRSPDARVEAAHDEAFLRLRRAQVEYPQILSAFDAVLQWADERGVPAVGPPREVYFADVLAAAPGDEVCDVAVPISPGA